MADDRTLLHEAVDAPSWELPSPPMASRSVRAFEVCVELAGDATDDEVRASLCAELGPDVTGWLQELEPRLGTTGEGHAALLLTVPGVDVWTCALTAMAALRQLGHDPLALHVEQRHLRAGDRPAA
jgi:hypothetical protein